MGLLWGVFGWGVWGVLWGTVEPRFNGPASNRIPPITDANLWTPQVDFFYFLYWQ